MPTLEEDFQAYLETERLKDEFARSSALKTYLSDIAQGGAIRQGPPPAPSSVGATIGGIVGSLAAPTIPYVPGTVGSVLGELGQQGYELATGQPTAPSSLIDSAKRVTQQAAYGVVGEAAGRGIAKFALKSAAPFAAQMQPEAKEVIRFLQPRTRLPLLPAEATSSRILDILENVGEYSLLGGGAIKAFKDRRYAEVFQKIAEEIVDDLGPRWQPDDVGRAVVETIKRNKEVARIPAKLQYEAIDAAASPEYFDAIARMKVQRLTSPIEKDVISKMSVRPEVETLTKEAIKRMRVKDITSPIRDTDKIIGFDDAGDSIVERITDGGVLQRLRVHTTRQNIPVAEELRSMNVQTTYKTIQVGELLERLKVMTTTVERQISGPRIDLTPLQEKIAATANIARRAGGLADREMGTTLLAFVQEKPEIVSYPVAKQIRTEIRTLRDVLQKSPETKNAPAIAKATQVYDDLTKAIRRGLADYDPFLAEQWDEANFVERAVNLQFANRLTQQLITKADERRDGAIEDVARRIFEGGLSMIRKSKNAIADEQVWNKVLSGHLRHILEEATDPVTKQLQGKSLQQRLFGPNGIGEQTMLAAYGPDRTRLYHHFITALLKTQERQAEGTGRMLIQLKQGGAFLEVAGGTLAALGLVGEGEYTAEGVGIMLTPVILSRLMTNPTTAKWLIEGFSLPARTTAGMALAGRIIQAAFPRWSVTESRDRADTRRVSPPVSSRPPMAFPLQP